MERRGWALARGARETKRRFDEGWGGLPGGRGDALRRWAVVIVLGWLLGAALAAGLSVAGKHFAEERGMADWDRRELLDIATGEKGEAFSFQTAIFFEGLGSSAMLIPLTVLAVVLAARARRPLTALTIAAGYLLHDPLVWVGWKVWDRARPELVADGIASPPLHSYPSGHAVQMMAVYGLLAYLWARRSGSVVEKGLAAVLVAGLALVVSYARVRLGTHWPSDIGAGLVIGAFWLAVCVVALRRGEAGA
jgi:undecaprenyl-diphosphatase